MTRDESRAIENKLQENKIGALFLQFERLLEAAWAADGKIEAQIHEPSAKALKAVRDKFNLASSARAALVSEILKDHQS